MPTFVISVTRVPRRTSRAESISDPINRASGISNAQIGGDPSPVNMTINIDAKVKAMPSGNTILRFVQWFACSLHNGTTADIDRCVTIRMINHGQIVHQMRSIPCVHMGAHVK